MNPARGLLLAGVLTATPLGADAQLATAPCRLIAPWLPGVAAECATLDVPEDRGEPNGHTIRLFVARVSSVNAAPRNDPLVIIAGGPGQGAVDFYLHTRTAFEQVRRDRDIVLLDQRGTGRSAQLTCSDVSAATLEQADVGALPDLMRACLADLPGNPRFYTSSVAVTDLETLRQALGVAQWNLYGVSYGTRVAQHYLRRYPEHTRGVILDGVVPSDTPLGPDVSGNAQRVLDSTIARCTADPPCAARFPQLAAQLDALLATLTAAPVVVTVSDPLSGEPETRPLTAEQFASVLRLMSYTPQSAALLPLLIATARDGNYAPVTAQSAMLADELESVLSLPMHNAVVCTEDEPFFPPESASGSQDGYLGRSVVDALHAVCSVWPAGVIDADLREPLQSDRPVLILSGELDPITPPAYGERVLARLGNARHLVGRGQGHGLAGIGCVPRLMREFLELQAPTSLDASCLERARPSPFFLDFNGPSP